MNASVIRDVISLAQAEKTYRGRMSYLLRGLAFLPFLMRDPLVQARQDRDGENTPHFDDIYPLF